MAVDNSVSCAGKIEVGVATLTNKELLSKCKEYGREALRWKWKFAGLLPEVEKRKLWQDAGFESVFHFSKVLAGMSEMQVKQALRLERKFENLPKLKELFHEGTVSPNRLDRIGAVVTEENEEELAQVVQMHSRRAVDTLVRDVQIQSLSGQSMIEAQSQIVATDLQLSEELKSRLLKLKEKGSDINELLMELLDLREEMVKEEKEAIAEEIEKKEKVEAQRDSGKRSSSRKRYINARTKRVLRAEHGTKCSIETCAKPAAELHHTRRFALAPNNNPKFLAPLCKGHHELAAKVNVRYLEYRKK